MNKKLWIWIAVLIVAIALLIGIIQKSNNKETTGPKLILSYAENQQSDYPTTLGGQRFAELVEERTNGRIKIMVNDSGSMGTETDVLTQMKYGGVDMARVSISQLSAYAPEMNVLQMPYLYRDSEHMWQVLDGEIGDRFLSELSADAFVGLSWYDAGARSFYTTAPIEKLEDMEGLVIRVQDSKLMIDAIEALGAKAVTTDYAEVFSAIETGKVDGAENNWPSYESMDHYVVAPFFTEDEHTRVPEMQLISAHTWSKLSEEDKAIFRECAKESAIYERELWSEREKQSKSAATAEGAKVISISADEKKRFQAAMSDVYEKYCGSYMDIIGEILALED